MSELEQRALEYADRGWPIFPCHPRTKQPLIQGGFKNASIDPAQIKAWLTKWPKALIAVATGPDSKIFVIDFDAGQDKDTGEIFELVDLIAAFEAFAEVKLPNTCSATTPRGGRHLYFEFPDGEDIRRRIGIIPRVDICGSGGYVILPPSVRGDGVPYVWERAPDTCPPLKPTARLIEVLRRKKPVAQTSKEVPAAVGHTNRYSQRYAQAALRGEASELAGTPRGQRNHRLNVAAYRIGQICDFSDLGEFEIFDALEAAAVGNGLVADDGVNAVRRTIASGLAAGRMNPRPPSHKPAEHGAGAAVAVPGVKQEHSQVDLELANLELTDLGNARRFAKRHAARLKSSTQGWFYWNGSRWVADGAEPKVKQAVHETVDALKREASVMRKSEPKNDDGDL